MPLLCYFEKMISVSLEHIFSACKARLVPSLWHRVAAAEELVNAPSRLPAVLEEMAANASVPGFLPDLARVEWAVHEADEGGTGLVAQIDERAINPTVQLLAVEWQGLADLIAARNPLANEAPRPGSERLLVWFSPETRTVRCRKATDEDLLVLKMMVESIDPRTAAAMGGVPVGALDNAVTRAVAQGILLAPPSRIRRDTAMFPVQGVAEEFLASQVFTVQWHITQACDLHCKHCYDRSSRPPVALPRGLAILDELRGFCLDRQVRGQVSFSGGNPLLHPNFLELYQGAAERGLMTAILGNPTSREQLEAILAIQPPGFFQVSLEGLEAHNNEIRGRGHFQRTLDFLELLRELGIYSMVMLTLTRDNQAQVLPLAELLRDKVDLFTFNRLAMVGEGAKLLSVRPADLPAFLADYLAAAGKNPVLSLKDNLLNIIRHGQAQPLFGGCAGYGCGAAFNFLCILPDGEAHACRKFPSPIGNINRQRLVAIYASEAAQRYRAGCRACRECPIRATCGGCLAVVHGYGLDVFKDKDPYCFFESETGGG